MKTVLYYFSQKMQKAAEEQYASWERKVDDRLESFFDVSYSGADHNDLFLDVYRPKKLVGHKLPVIIMIHGGGLYVGNRTLSHGVCQEFAMRGFLVFNLEYRLLTEADACGEIADICSGLQYIEKILDQFKGDKDRIYIAAESAGAYLALYTAAIHVSEKLRSKIGCNISGLKIQKMAAFSGMFYTKRMDLIGMVYPLQIYGKKCLDLQYMKYMNPENPEVILNLPPMLLTSSDADFLKKYTLSYAESLKSNNRYCKLMYYTGNKELTHAFPSYRLDLMESIEVIDEVCYHFFV